MRKWTLAFVVSLFFIPLMMYAGGRQDNESHEVDNPSGFSESINIENKKPGKWNVYLEAKDKGGNTTIAGPHNLYIDPESDLPIARIINPQPNMRVQGNLNLVGTCIDDDGVAYVNLVITKGKDGKGEVMFETRADGAEFWSFFLDTSDTGKWKDGVYTVTAWGTDINGLSGISDKFPAKVHKTHSVTWNLDRKKPDITVTSHSQGALVSGKVTIKGTVWDGNGINSLSYSLDDGEHYTPISIKYDTKADMYNYDFTLDTKTVEDGPKVIMFKARDNMRSEGALSFLIFANNTGPEVEILYPDDTTAVSGIFSVSGSAKHKIGLSSLKWKSGKDSGDIPIIPGNPWWVQEIDIRGQNVKSLDLEIQATDVSGNVTTAKKKILVDQEAAMPKISLTEPAAGALIPEEGLNIIGQAAGNEGVEAILYSLDGKPAVEVPSSGYFQLTVNEVPEGTHSLKVWARSITGVAGPAVTVNGLVSQGSAPHSRIVQVRSSAARNNQVFYSGIEVNNEQGSTLDVAIRSGGGLNTFTYQLGNRDPVTVSVKSAKAGEYTQTIPVPKEMELGMTRVLVTAVDNYERQTVMEDYVCLSNSAGDRGYSTDFYWVNPNRLPDGRILLSTTDPLYGVFAGGPVQSVYANGEGANSLLITPDDFGRVMALGAVNGNFGPIQLDMTTSDGKRGSSREASRFLVYGNDPALEYVTNPDGRWVRKDDQGPNAGKVIVDLKFRVIDDLKMKSIEFSTDLGSSWNSLVNRNELEQLDSSTLVERQFDISNLPDGAVGINLRVVNEAERKTVSFFTVNKDTVAPEAELIVPTADARVNGTIRLGIAVKETGGIASVYYERPEKTIGEGEDMRVLPAISRQIYPDPSVGPRPLTVLAVDLDSTVTPLDEDMSLVFTDMAGNSFTMSRWPFLICPEDDLPVVQVSLPLEDEVITSDFIISGVCYDDDGIARVYWSMDDGYEKVIEVKNGFSIPVPLSSMTDNEHYVTIYAEDIFGVKGTPVVRNFRVSLEEPTAYLSMPTATDIVGGDVRIIGMASDENGIKRVQVSLDNGNSYNDAEGTTRWNYNFNSKVLPDGNHAVFVRVWDNYDIFALYSFLINIDNTPPELTVDTPRDGTVTTGPIYITGQVMDSMKLETVEIVVASLEGVEIPDYLAEKETKLDALLLDEIDLSPLPDGSYNIEIWATDKAGNATRISRNVTLAKESQRNYVDTLYPLNGEHLQGIFNLYGIASGIDKATDVTLVVNGLDVRTEQVSEAGYYCFAMTSEDLSTGNNRIVVRSNFGGREMVQSAVRTIEYQPYGPWVTVDTMNMGDFAYERPWLMGRAGYVLSEMDLAILADKKVDKDVRLDVEAKKVSLIELSFNNGRTFFPAGKSREKGYDWRYRLETQDMTEGIHYLIVRATMVNGEVAVSRLIIQVDKTPPVIRLISPEAGGRYNTEMNFAALASDDVELKSLSYYLRKGDKSAYEIPGFIKGLYLEGTIPPFIRVIWNSAPAFFAGGATFFDIGLGLSFFDDNVKIQATYGQMTQKQYEMIGGVGPVRYGGHVLGVKILANVYTLPFGSFGGPDWDWLSASLAFGANFSCFDMAKQGYTQSGNRSWMSALIGQLEFPKVTIPKRTYLRTFSMFTEGQIWFVPTDVNAAANKVKTVIPHVILGLRMYIF